MLFLRENYTIALCIFFLKIVKSLQLRGRKKIVEPRKYCFVSDYFSLAYNFSLLLHLMDLGISYVFPIKMYFAFHTLSTTSLFQFCFKADFLNRISNLPHNYFWIYNYICTYDRIPKLYPQVFFFIVKQIFHINI